MKLSALEIKSQEFKRTLRGVDEAEVQSFLGMIASQWQEQQDDLRRTEEKLRELEAKIIHYQRIEEALQEALTSAKASSKATVAEATRRAEMVILEAEAKARATEREVENRVVALHGSLSSLGQRRKEVIARMRAFLRSELEMLDDFGSQTFERIPDLPDEIRFKSDENQYPAATSAPYSRRRAADLLNEPSSPNDTAGLDNPGYHDSMLVDGTPGDSPDVLVGSESDQDDQYEMDGSDDMAASIFPDGLDESDRYDDRLGDESATDYSDEPEFHEYEEDGGFATNGARGPIEHQEYQSSDAGFDAEPNEIFVDESDLRGEPAENLKPSDTESRIRRILDNLG
jgi:DivIVA domain-containing protein